MAFIHIIYAGTRILLSRKPYLSWREIQEEFCDYTASLGPWSEVEVTEFLSDEYRMLMPSAATQVSAFIDSDAVIKELSFVDKSGQEGPLDCGHSVSVVPPVT
ncbi:hypothetical protein [Cupriavidus sp. UME77]|uniref:hypothetical protein n=1 Tax=Cupriavidus sp. UME77 TaxID=1862321 RepID=UPI0015FEDDB5|nr:hypothetical protein [Cupriavidus sp. UME77]